MRLNPLSPLIGAFWVQPLTEGNEMGFYGDKSGSYDTMGWYIETPSEGVGTVSKIHLTKDGNKTLCGVSPSRNAVMIELGSELCWKCEGKR